MTKEIAERIARGITDKIKCNTVDIDDWAEFWGFTREEYEEFLEMSIEALEQQSCEDVGELSDGYHTFNQLYHQRAVLFATIVNQNKDRAWKSFKHDDGKYCFDKDGEWFIVGIDTPKGSYTYHYSKEYWDYFDCEELECGKPWDGHTEEDVIRLLSLPSVTPQPKVGEWIKTFEPNEAEPFILWECNRCHMIVRGSMKSDYCPFCGARMNGGNEE